MTLNGPVFFGLHWAGGSSTSLGHPGERIAAALLALLCLRNKPLYERISAQQSLISL